MTSVIPINKRPLLDALPKQPSTGLTSVELFAGGGLMRLGIEWAGIETIWANDFDKNAVRAHTHNFGEGACTHGDITEISINDIPDADIIVGGPPCQDFSVAGKGAGEAGDRGKLVWRYLEIIEAKRPKAFLFENVKGLTTKRHRPTLDALLAKFDEIGYNVNWRVISAWDYGVAQKRERIFVVGIRKDIGVTYEFPASEYETSGYRPVLRDAIGDLPEPNDGTNGHIQTQATTVKPQQNLSFQRSYTADWEKPARTVNTNRLDHAEIHPGNHEKNPQDGKYSSQFLSRNRVVGWDDAGFTVLTNARDASIHPADSSFAMDDVRTGVVKPRRFTVRECLRIQSVPDTYVFPDDMSLSAMYRVVGNGVASRVAYHLGKTLAEQLLAANATTAAERRDAA